jgi:hypothetical protein
MSWANNYDQDFLSKADAVLYLLLLLTCLGFGPEYELLKCPLQTIRDPLDGELFLLIEGSHIQQPLPATINHRSRQRKTENLNNVTR